MLTNKIESFLQRDFYKGSSQTVSFKGRDLFDIVWFIQRSAKSELPLKPDWSKLESDLKLEKGEIFQEIIDKVRRIRPQDVFLDLSAFVESQDELDGFIQNYQEIIEKKLTLLA